MNELIFREYDIRGLYEKELNESVTKAIFYALGLECVNRGCKNISLAYDARLSAKALFKYALIGLNEAGLKVYSLGLVPTPLGYFSVYREGGFDASVVITGSHNPKEYNGFKITIKKESFFGQSLQKLIPEAKKYLEFSFKNEQKYEDFDIITPYVEYLYKAFLPLKGMDLNMVIDVFNGAAGEVITKLVNKLDLKAIILNAKPDGNFTKHDPDPSKEENLKELASYLDANNIGFAFDGDADRLAVMDIKRIYKGDELCYLFAKQIKNPRVMGEVKCSQNLYDEVAKFGTIIMGKTGHSNIKKAMKEQNIDLAAELSGHIFFKDRYFGFDDGIYALFRVLELLKAGVDMNGLLEALPRYYSSKEIKIKTSESEKFALIKAFKQKALKEFEYKSKCEIDGLRLGLNDGWVLLRASNTSPFLILRAEAKTEANLAKYIQKVEKIIQNLKK